MGPGCSKCLLAFGIVGVISGIVSFTAYDSLYHYIMKTVNHLLMCMKPNLFLLFVILANGSEGEFL